MTWFAIWQLNQHCSELMNFDLLLLLLRHYFQMILFLALMDLMEVILSGVVAWMNDYRRCLLSVKKMRTLLTSLSVE